MDGSLQSVSQTETSGGMVQLVLPPALVSVFSVTLGDRPSSPEDARMVKFPLCCHQFAAAEHPCKTKQPVWVLHTGCLDSWQT